MGAENNYWDPDRKEWIDPDTGNHMKPVDQGGDGQWHNAANNQILIQGQGWVPYTDNTGGSSGTGSRGTGAAGANSTGAYSPQAGGDYNLQDSVNATNVKLEEMRDKNAKEIAELNRAAQSSLQDKLNDLQLQLKNKDITEAQYELAKRQAQEESEFARNLALDQLKEAHSYEINQQSMQVQRAAEARQERALEASLGANPQDWVAYELYQRGKAAPNAIGLNTPVTGGPSVGTGAGGSSAGTQLNGDHYTAASPAYDDASLQNMVQQLWNPTPTGYNPNLSGTGVFGTQIESPNNLSRAEAGNLSDTEMGLLQGLLRGGITMPNGKRVALNPQDYFTQAGKSWVPTLSGAGPQTQYS